jgi:hypothetical protein
MPQKRRVLVAFEDDDANGSNMKRQKKIVVSKMVPLQVCRGAGKVATRFRLQ